MSFFGLESHPSSEGTSIEALNSTNTPKKTLKLLKLAKRKPKPTSPPAVNIQLDGDALDELLERRYASGLENEIQALEGGDGNDDEAFGASNDRPIANSKSYQQNSGPRTSQVYLSFDR